MKFNIIQDKVKWLRQNYQDQHQEEKSIIISPILTSEIGDR